MNKGKVMELTIGLVHDTQNALLMRDQAAFQSCVEREKGIIDELNSKPVMPKVFDEWVKSYAFYNAAELLEGLILNQAKLGNTSDNRFVDWLTDESKGVKTIDKALMAIDALRYGYEVEK